MAPFDPRSSLDQPLLRRVLRQAADLAEAERAALTPAAVRVERTRARRGAETAEQTAITLWFGEGPALPSPGSARQSGWRAAAGMGLTLAGAAALAVASSLATAQEERRRVAAGEPVRRLRAPGARGRPAA